MRSLAYRLNVTVGAIVLIATIAVSLAGYVSGRSSIEGQIRERIGATARTAAAETDAYLAARVEELRQMSTSALQVTTLSGADRAKILFDYANAFGSNHYTEIAIVDAAGHAVIASTGAPSYADQPAIIRTIRDAARPGILDVTRFADQQQDVFVVYAPLLDENAHRYGTLVGRLATTELNALIHAVPLDASSSIALTHGGVAIASAQGAHGPAFGKSSGAFTAIAAIATRGVSLQIAGAVDPAGALVPVNALAVRCALAGIVVLVLAGIATLLTARRLARPLRAVATAASRLAGGDLQARADVEREIREAAELADAFNAMADALRELIESLDGTARTAAQTARETLASSQAVRGESEEQARAATQIADALAGVVAGARAIGTDARGLQRSSQDGLAHLDSLVAQVDGTSAAVEQLRLSVERTNQAGGMLADQAISVAERAREVAHRALEATASADRGGEAVRNLVADVGELGAALAEIARRLQQLAGATADAITTQVDVIEDVSERSQLLALNAAIEAARVGEHGAGFAVIAGELHRLASGSRVASDRVKSLVASVVAETQSVVDAARGATALADAAVGRAELTGGTIEALVGEIADNAAKARAIEATAAEQVDRSAEIRIATAEMREMAEATALAAGAARDRSRGVRAAVELATRVATQVADATSGQEESFDRIERGTREIGAASAAVARAAQRSFDATDALDREIQRIADRVARFGSGGTSVYNAPIPAVHLLARAME